MRPLSFEFGAIEIEREYTGFDTSVYRVFGAITSVYRVGYGWGYGCTGVFTAVSGVIGWYGALVTAASRPSLVLVAPVTFTSTVVHKPLHLLPHRSIARAVTGGRGGVAARVEHVEEGQNAVVVQILGLWHRA